MFHSLNSSFLFPLLRSLTYEARLLKYVSRGFAVGVPNLDLTEVESPEEDQAGERRGKGRLGNGEGKQSSRSEI